jgi:hypothetical protein
MVTFQLYLVKDPTGIRVNADYQSGHRPVFLERVNVEELDANGSVIYASTNYVREYFGTASGSNYLFTHAPARPDAKTIRANGFYVEIDKVAGSNVVTM